MSGAHWLEGDLTSVALCWRIERRDGVALGLTSHDRDLAIDGIVHRAAPGMVPSAITRGDAAATGMEIEGALASEAISERDLLAGRWDGARVEVFAVDWETPDAPLSLGGGRIGAVELRAEGFSAELRDAMTAMDAPASERTSPDCRAALGDRRCRVPMARRRQWARVIDVEGDVVTLDRSEPVINAYGDGRVVWFGGDNSGLESIVLRSAGARVTLRRPPRHATAGALVRIEEGCDKRLETCRARFANAVNFQGEPHLPGIDLLTRYPGG